MCDLCKYGILKVNLLESALFPFLHEDVFKVKNSTVFKSSISLQSDPMCLIYYLLFVKTVIRHYQHIFKSDSHFADKATSQAIM